MSLQKNIFEQVKDDAVAEARANDPHVPTSGANFATGQLQTSTNLTQPNEANQTVYPLFWDVDDWDNPNAVW